MTNQPMCEWWVYVHTPGVGCIGTVSESTEDLARLAALSRYAKEGKRLANRRRPETMFIFEDDNFDVRR